MKQQGGSPALIVLATHVQTWQPLPLLLDLERLLPEKNTLHRCARQVALVQHMLVTIMTARRKVEDAWRAETNALRQFQQLESDVAQQVDTVLTLAPPPPPPLLCGRSLCRLTWTDDALKR